MARKSKLEPYLDKLGIFRDSLVAEMAGVSSENVRAYRKRRGIPARWRGEGEPLPGEAGATAPAAHRAKRRKSKLDPYLELVGILPDRVIAARAGATAENVRAWRRRRGIPARWRGEGEPLPNEEAILALETGQAPRSTASVPAEPERAPQSEALQGFEVIVQGPEGSATYITTGANIADAGQRAMRGLSRRGIPGTITTIRYLADVLQL